MLEELAGVAWEKLGIIGVLGVMLVAFATGRLYTRAQVQHLLDENQRLRAERDKQTEVASRAIDMVRTLTETWRGLFRG